MEGAETGQEGEGRRGREGGGGKEGFRASLGR
jgi:hypothetical protein